MARVSCAHAVTTPREQVKDALGSDAGEELAAVIDRIDPIRGDIAELRHEMQNLGTRMELRIERGLREQTKFFFLAWGVILAAIIGLYAR